MNLDRLFESLAICSAASAPGAWFSTLIDDVDDGVFSGWTAQAGSADETVGTPGGASGSLFTRDGLTGSTFSLSALAGCASLTQAAIVLDHDASNANLFVKLQDNDGPEGFDTVFIYVGNNGPCNAPLASSGAGAGAGLAPATPDVTDRDDGPVTVSVPEASFSTTQACCHEGSDTGVGIGVFGDARLDAFFDVGACPCPQVLR